MADTNTDITSESSVTTQTSIERESQGIDAYELARNVSIVGLHPWWSNNKLDWQPQSLASVAANVRPLLASVQTQQSGMHYFSSRSDDKQTSDTTSTPFVWARPNEAPCIPIIPTALQGQPGIAPLKDPFSFMETCPIKGVITFGAGGVLGLLAGVVIGGWQSATPPMPYPGCPEPPSVPAAQALKETGEMMIKKSKSWAKNFAKVGAIYSTVECGIEKTRARHDMQNAIFAGCATGAALAYKQGPVGMALGCGGFAAFSAAMEVIMPGH